MVGKFLNAKLSGTTTAATRVYPLVLPQNPQYPAATYQLIASVREHGFGIDATLGRYRVQVDAWASTYAAARQLADEIRAQLSRFKGIVAGIDVRDVFVENEIELHEAETGIRRVLQEYLIFTQE